MTGLSSPLVLRVSPACVIHKILLVLKAGDELRGNCEVLIQVLRRTGNIISLPLETSQW